MNVECKKLLQFVLHYIIRVAVETEKAEVKNELVVPKNHDLYMFLHHTSSLDCIGPF